MKVAPLTPQQKAEIVKRGFSRRSFSKFATLIAAGTTLPFYNEPALAQLSKVEDAGPDAVFINANENPLGPAPEALEACRKIAADGGRYRFNDIDKLTKLLASQEHVKAEYVNIYPGSSMPLHQAVLAFTTKDKPLVMGDPGYEAGERAAKFIGSSVVRVPLGKDFAHDVKKMLAAHATPGLIYICNPNNPTGTLTSKSDLEWIVANKPKGTIVMIDEAYTHIAGAPFNTDLVAQDKDVVVLRTFSKIYGMAGLRVGAAIGRPDLLEKLGGFSHHTMMPVTGVAAAQVSLSMPNLIPERRKKIGDVRQDTFEFLSRHNVHYVPSVSNCFMVDTKKPGNELVKAMAKQQVYIGRVWPAWPTFVRVTVGLPEEMKKFQTAFLKAYEA